MLRFLLVFAFFIVSSEQRPEISWRSADYFHQIPSVDDRFRSQFAGKFIGAGNVEGVDRLPFSTPMDSPFVFMAWKRRNAITKMSRTLENLQSFLNKSVHINVPPSSEMTSYLKKQLKKPRFL